MLAKMSFLWSDSTSPSSKTSGRDKEKLKEAVVQSKDIDKGSLKSLKQVEMDKPRDNSESRATSTESDPSKKSHCVKKQTKVKSDESQESSDREVVPEQINLKNEEPSDRNLKIKASLCLPSKAHDDSGTSTKRKLFVNSNLNLSDPEEEKDDSFGILKRVKRSHKSEVKVPKLRVANAISSSLSSSMFEQESPLKPKTKRKNRSPENVANEKKYPKKVEEKNCKSEEKSSECEDLSALDSKPITSQLLQPASEKIKTSLHSEVNRSPKTNIREFKNSLNQSNHVFPEDEMERRLEFLDPEALEADRKRDQARADKFLAALDDLD